jgi:hypothetical protein
MARKGPRDLYGGHQWSHEAVEDLAQAVTAGATLDYTASFLCRSGEPFAVAKKAKELGLGWQQGGRRQKPKPT